MALTETVTLIADGPVSDEVYAAARQHFSDEELVNLTLTIITINGWNRLSLTFRTVPGSYKPQR